MSGGGAFPKLSNYLILKIPLKFKEITDLQSRLRRVVPEARGKVRVRRSHRSSEKRG
jgi:hypothetical protein